ncbi:MAG: efflux RND transporter periplasmic adaptor subunit [Dysgonamonadaceae bacterium]|jgi:HlyD family secretion protein|nr:efflux RND transporter periplasmic adaptor subunit [Dysgonamonadaceae bacterium]
MDREIPQSVKRKRIRKRIIQIGAIALGLVVFSVVISMLMKDSISRSALTIGVIDKGNIEVSVTASGRLVPLSEEIIVSPISSRILEIYKNAGDEVEEGEPLLRLDLASVETEYRQKLDEREIKRSRLIQLQIRLENTISELQMQQQIKLMRLQQLENDLVSEKHLDSIGASTRDRVRHAELAYGEARLELQQLAQKIENEKRTSEAELNIQRLELSIFEKTLQENERLLKDARILSPKKATLTFINNQIGAQIAQGTAVAIVSDLTRFKVEAEISDGHRERLSIGSTALIEIGNVQLNSTVVNIKPSIQNGIIEFTVIPDDSENPNLRSGLRANVYVLYGRKQDVLRIPNRGQFRNGRGHYFVWVINGDKAEKRRVGIGDMSVDSYEVTSGLSIGEVVILSDMERFEGREIIKIK